MYYIFGIMVFRKFIVLNNNHKKQNNEQNNCIYSINRHYNVNVIFIRVNKNCDYIK